MEQVLRGYLEHICGRENVRENVELSTKTTFRIGGPARFFVVVKSKEKLARLVSALLFIEYPWRIIGGGSNILASDRGFEGVVIRLGFCEIIENGNFVYADAGASLAGLCKRAVELGQGGLEFACGIPGTVGGAVRGNAGAFGSCVGEHIVIVDVLRGGEIVSVEARECGFGYRRSAFKRNGDIILGAYFHLQSAPPEEIRKRMEELGERRRASQPAGASAGSVFKNPETASALLFSKTFMTAETRTSAGEMIERAGLKGVRVGGAEVSRAHGNFIVNVGGATSGDVEALVRVVRKRVREMFGVRLALEIERF